MLLHCAVHDARDVHGALKRMKFDGQLLLNEDINVVRDAKDKFVASLKPDDVAVVYVAGHGAEASVCVAGNLVSSHWLLGKDLPKKNQELPVKAIDWHALVAEVEATSTRFNVFISDACRNDPLPTCLFGNGPKLPPMEPDKSLVMFSCKRGTRAIEFPGDRNGVFAKHLLRHLETPSLPLEALCKRVRRGVLEDTKSHQDPVMYDRILRENVTFETLEPD